MKKAGLWFSLLFLAGLFAACSAEATPTPLPATPTTAPSPTVAPVPTTAPATTVAPTTVAPTVPATTVASLQGGQKVDVGGYKIYFECAGTGSPAVIMDGGLNNSSTTWDRTVRLVSQFTQVCVYDRPGLGQSEAVPAPRNSQQFVKELRTVLSKVRLAPPYILVGQSLGGLNMQLFASQNPKEVAGMVLVDSLHPDFDARIEQLFTPEQARERRQELADNREKVSFDNILESEAQVKAARPLPDVPLIVLRHGIPFEFSAGWPADAVEKLWLDLQTDLANQTKQGKLVLAAKSPHRIQEFQPSLIADSVKEIYDKVKGK